MRVDISKNIAPESSDRRLAELMVYVAQKSAGHRTFGATKLNKILFFADFMSFERYGKAITDAEYMKLDQGPVPRRLLPQKNVLLDDGSIEEIEQMFGTYKQKRIIAKRPADLSLFAPRDIALVDELIEDFANKTATEVSEQSHGFGGWKMTNLKETIPYQSVFLSNNMPTEADMDWARDLNASEGWNA